MKSISELVIVKQWDIVNQGSLHQSFNKKLPNLGVRRRTALGMLTTNPAIAAAGGIMGGFYGGKAGGIIGGTVGGLVGSQLGKLLASLIGALKYPSYCNNNMPEVDKCCES